MDIEELQKKDKVLREAAEALKCEPAALPSIIEKFLHEIKTATEEMKKASR